MLYTNARSITLKNMTDRFKGALATQFRSQSAFPAHEIPRPKAEVLNKLGLSRRECEVLAWVAQGKTNSETAAALGINLGTVKKHVAHIFRKLGVESRTAAAAVAFGKPSFSQEDRR